MALVHDTDQATGRALAAFLDRNGLECRAVGRDDLEGLASRDAEEGLGTAAVILGGTDAEEVAASLRAAGLRNPILGLIDMRSSEREVSLLGAGCDCVLLRPVKPQVVAAQIGAIARRMHGEAPGYTEIGDLRIYFDGREPEFLGKPLKLSGREHAIFTLLALKAGRVVSKESIFQAVYGLQNRLPFDKVIDVYICKIRKKIAAMSGGYPYIETVHGRGYKLAAPEHASLAA